jgi:integrase
MPRRTYDGIKKRCDCPRRAWPKCSHPWHFSFHHNGREHRYSLDRIARARGERPPVGKTEAVAWRDQLRGKVRAGTFVDPDTPTAVTAVPTDTRLTLGDVIDKYIKRHVEGPTRREGPKKAMTWNLKLIKRTLVPAANGAVVPLEQKPAESITKADLEAFRERRRAVLSESRDVLAEALEIEAQAKALKRGRARSELRARARALRLSAKSRSGAKGGEVGINRLLARLRHVYSWAIEEGYVDETPFKRAGKAIVRLEMRMETARTRRLEPGEEERLLAAAGPHLRALIVAALSTGCRVGELLSLTWGQVRRDERGQPRWLLLPASKTKTNANRTIPVGPRLLAELSMRRHAPDGKEQPDTAFIFGNEVGEQIKSIKTAWRATCRRVGINNGLHFHDLRREFGSRLLESGASEHDVRDFLGHANITTTSRYLKSTPLRLEKVLANMEGGRIRTSFAQTTDENAKSEPKSSANEAAKPLIQ